MNRIKGGDKPEFKLGDQVFGCQYPVMGKVPRRHGVILFKWPFDRKHPSILYRNGDKKCHQYVVLFHGYFLPRLYPEPGLEHSERHAEKTNSFLHEHRHRHGKEPGWDWTHYFSLKRDTIIPEITRYERACITLCRIFPQKPQKL